jgi:polyphosphate kinase
MVAPYGIRSGIIRRIEREVGHVRAGRPGLIQIKANSIVDEQIIDALYRASQAGVRVDLLIRGICSLRAGVPGLSENIHVRSVLGRFLEHSRVLRFGNGATPDQPDGSAYREEFWIGSADLMHRNLDRRVEALVQVTDGTARRRLRDLLDLMLMPETGGFDLLPDNTWRKRTGPAGEPPRDPQAELLHRTASRAD